MATLVTFLHVIVCIVLVATVLLQQGKGGGMGGAFGGANATTVFGSGGASTFLRRLTAIAATMFMLTSMVLAYIASNDAGDALKSFSAQQAQLKKRKKAAEDAALQEAGAITDDGAGTGTGAVTPPPTGADVDDGDTGEDEAATPPATGPGTIEAPEPVITPADTVPSGEPRPPGGEAIPGKAVPPGTDAVKPPPTTTDLPSTAPPVQP